MCLQTELSTELYEAKNLVVNLLIRTLGDSNLNIFWQLQSQYQWLLQLYSPSPRNSPAKDLSDVVPIGRAWKFV